MPLNRGKRRTLLDLVLAYANVKDSFLRLLGRTGAWHHLDKPRALRAETKTNRRKGMPAHLQDQARFDAVDTIRRFVEAGIAATHVRSKLYHRFEKEKRHYGFWILRSYGRIGMVLRGEAPQPPHPTAEYPKVKPVSISVSERKEVVRFLRRSLRKALGRAPRVHLRRSFALDSTLYGSFEHNGRQYVSIASLLPRKRRILPLGGRGRISGNVRIVLNPARATVSVHLP